MNQTSVLLPEDMMLHRARSMAEACAGFRPRFAGRSEYLAQLPFLAWLTGLLHPRQVIGLGVGTGVGYFTLCQAIAKANLPAEVYGIELWRGADGLPQVPEAIEQENAAQYAGFSRLVSATPRSAVGIFDMEEIDLLFVDLEPAADLGALLCEGWAPLMTERGVIVLRDAAAAEPLKAAWPYLEFDGVTAVLVGRDLPPTVQALTTLPEAGWLKLVEPLRAAGQVLLEAEAELLARDQEAALALELQEMQARLAAAEALRADQLAQIAALQAQSAADAVQIRDLSAREASLEVALGQRDQALAALSAREEAAEAARLQEAARLSALEANLAELHQEGAKREEAMARRDLALAQQASQIETLTNEAAAQQASLTERNAELVILTRIAEDHRAQLGGATKALGGAKKAEAEALKLVAKTAEKVTRLTAERKEARDFADKATQQLALEAARAVALEQREAALEKTLKKRGEEIAQLTKQAKASQLAAEKAAEKLAKLTAERKEARDFADKAVQQLALDAAALEGFAQREAALQQSLARQSEELVRLTRLAEDSRKTAEKLGEKTAKLTAERKEARDLVDQAVQQLALEAAQNAQLADLVTEQKKVLVRRDGEMARLEAMAVTGQARAAEASARLDAQGAALKAADEAAAQQKLRIAALERSEAHNAQALIAAQQAQTHLHQALAAARAEIAGLNQGVEIAQGEALALRNSTSWKMTAPIRKVREATQFRRQESPAGE